ncbi:MULTISPECIES: RNA polymerase sigma factor [Proteiniphilum]|jgi:RNA polymerase sigma factor (sigma-70 family)|uniref:RNA polymerase sigma factor n=3 Tax=Dysgonomonadaceae TaxID=2005520 RepID=UPI001EECC3E7|nr:MULTISPECIES: sigma-70 family RNA polymerase sigma factor [Proteiniphilum]ULB34760.1 sigma-70 family RNA polymerase sigma factor [Proteiniphilum propionicum]
MQENNRYIVVNKYWKEFLANKNGYDAFSFIYNFYVNDLLSYGLSLGFDEETCRDAVHDVFCKILIDKSKFLKVRNLTSYLFRSLRNKLFNIQKRNCKISDSFFENIPFSTEITTLESLISREDTEKLKQTVENLLNELTPRQREIIYLRYMQELDYEEIAILMEINYNSARRLVHRSIEHLRSMNKDPERQLFVILVALTYYHYL